VIGKDHSSALVIIVDRVTSFTVSKRVNSKSADMSLLQQRSRC
jgi:hypothetical protein